MIIARVAEQWDLELDDLLVTIGHCFVSDFLGVSGRRMLKALISGERDPGVLAELVAPNLRTRREVLIEALTGYFTDHHAFVAQTMLNRIDEATAMEQRLNARIEEHTRPFQRQVDLLATIPRG
ncbi:hypothetical protein ACFV2X_25205 [Streptomyces sp. NPDC059679]|uniref:hypothetical protein n=1 Tax=Streptomyces sp. NPDC059679 TaxID=3346903 RepID=UPI0036812340